MKISDEAVDTAAIVWFENDEVAWLDWDELAPYQHERLKERARAALTAALPVALAAERDATLADIGPFYAAALADGDTTTARVLLALSLKVTERGVAE